jgi:hypothetical protein
MRRSSSVPRSNSWLPTEETSRPIALSTSMVGSSLNTLDSNGEALTRSPAPTKNEAAEPPAELRNADWSRWTVAATFAEPPTSVTTSSGVPYAPSGPGAVTSWLSPPVVTETRPWKSFMATSWTSTSPGAAAADPGTATTVAEATRVTARGRHLRRTGASRAEQVGQPPAGLAGLLRSAAVARRCGLPVPGR